jgi:heat shock protein HslJ
MRLASPAKPALTLLVLVAVAALASFMHTGRVIAQQSLAGTSWNVQSYNSQGNQASVISGSKPTLAFGTDGTVSGDTGCNNFSGSYTASGSTITFGPMASTLRACTDPNVTAQEQAYLAALGNSTTYQLSADQLVLADASGNPQVVLTAASSSLAGTAWRILSINNGNQAVVSVVTGTAVTFSLGQDGVATGSTGCNDFRTLYIFDATSLGFGPVITTRRACSEALANQEQWLLAALAASSTYTLSGNILNVRDSGGSTQFTASTPAIAPLPAPGP